MAAENEDTKTGQSPKVTAKSAKAQTPQKPAEGQNNPPPAGGVQPKGNVDPNDRSGEKGVVKTPAPGVTGTILNVTLNDAARNTDVQVGGRAVPRAGAGRPGDPWGTRAALDEKRARQHEINMANQAAERERIRKIGEEATARYKARQEKRQAAIESGDFTDLTTISQDTWNKLGNRNGQVRYEDVTNEDGSLVMKDGKPEQKAFRNEGSMFDVAKGTDAIGKLEKWWAEEGVATSAKAIPKGVFDENGKLKTDGLTADQFGALQKIMENSQAKLAPIRQRAELNSAQNYMNASEYLQNKGVKVWDTSTGQRLLSKDQVMQMAREMKLGDAREALKGLNASWAKANETPVDSEGKAFTDKKDIDFYQRRQFGQAKADEAALVAKMRDLGFRADQIADDKGNIDYTRIASALAGANQPAAPAKTEAPVAKPKETPAAPAAKPEPKNVDVPAKPAPEVPAAKPRAEVPAEAPAPAEKTVDTATTSLPNFNEEQILSDFNLGPMSKYAEMISPDQFAQVLANAQTPKPEPKPKGFWEKMGDALASSQREKPAFAVGMPGMLPVTFNERNSEAGRKAERDALMFSGEMIAGQGLGGLAAAGVAKAVPAVARVAGKAIGRRNQVKQAAAWTKEFAKAKQRADQARKAADAADHARGVAQAEANIRRSEEIARRAADAAAKAKARKVDKAVKAAQARNRAFNAAEQADLKAMNKAIAKSESVARGKATKLAKARGRATLKKAYDDLGEVWIP